MTRRTTGPQVLRGGVPEIGLSGDLAGDRRDGWFTRDGWSSVARLDGDALDDAFARYTAAVLAPGDPEPVELRPEDFEPVCGPAIATSKPRNVTSRYMEWLSAGHEGAVKVVHNRDEWVKKSAFGV